ncbi:MAG: hypothetical protein WCE79_30125 [Xanthobacteraceae bacterium]
MWIKVTPIGEREDFVLNTDHIVALEPTTSYNEPATRIVTTTQRKGGGAVAYEVKGAPERIANQCKTGDF